MGGSVTNKYIFSPHFIHIICYSVQFSVILTATLRYILKLRRPSLQQYTKAIDRSFFVVEYLITLPVRTVLSVPPSLKSGGRLPIANPYQPLQHVRSGAAENYRIN